MFFGACFDKAHLVVVVCHVVVAEAARNPQVDVGEFVKVGRVIDRSKGTRYLKYLPSSGPRRQKKFFAFFLQAFRKDMFPSS